MPTLLILNRDQMGHGDAVLGERLLKTFLQKAVTLKQLDTIALYNTGAKLVAADSPVLGELVLLEERGVDLIPCGTCLAHYDVEPAVGHAMGMDDIVAMIGKAQKVVTI